MTQEELTPVAEGAGVLEDYERKRVPLREGRGLLGMTLVLMSLCVAIPSLLLGAALVEGMGLRQAITATLWGALLGTPVCMLAAHVGGHDPTGAVITEAPSLVEYLEEQRRLGRIRCWGVTGPPAELPDVMRVLDKAAVAQLTAMMSRFNEAANWLAGVAFEHRCEQRARRGRPAV